MHRTSGRNSYDGKIAGLYDLEETLGRGHFAVVKLARHVFTGEKVAVKVIDKSKLDEISRAHLFQEVRCMKLVQHPNVVRLYEVIDTQTKLYLILELGDGGDLYDYIMRHDGGLGEEVAREYFRQIVRAISYCHRLHVVHRDLKPENVVFFERLGMVKLTDFGFSNRFNPGQKLETSCGSLAYSAPEILLGDSYDAPAVDIWSLGVILYMLVCGQAPFQEANDSETLTMIMDCKYTIPIHVSDACKRLIARMLVREPERRASLEEIAADPWLGEDLNTQPTDFLPLVSREHVSEEDHALIIQKMVNGNIATKEEILDALDKNEYNHITATYFLLAERKLRLHRQEQAQAQQRLRLGHCLPELSQMTGKPYTKVDSNQQQDCPSAVNETLLSVRTPGDVPQNYRARKCSIVQEEEDEDDMSSSGREELTAPHNSLNRRGSRSEGKLNIALQERLAESERRKEKAVATSVGQKATTQATTGSPGVLRVAARDDTSSSTIPSWSPPARKTSGSILDFRPKSAVESTSKANVPAAYIPGSNKWKITPKQPKPMLKPPSLPSVRVSCVSSTSIITESSTISIPVHTLSEPGMPLLPKYKTMPSPTRPMHSVLSSPQLALNEIFEEGDGDENLGPRPNSRVVGRQQGQGRPGGYEQRRSKFHKTRTASCSSSDASDDDSESRKKRAHKLGETGKSLPQRRDSHDDSSDSQDPGGSGGTGGGVGGGGTPAGGTQCGGRPPVGTGAGVSDSSRTSGGNGNAGSSGKRQCSETSQQPSLNRRHRTGRRRAGETRLRESQSLNRITEVQEAEQSCHSSVVTSRSTSSSSSSPRVRGFGARLLQSWSLAGSTAKRVAGGEVKSSNVQSDVASVLNSTARPQAVPRSPNTLETNCCTEEKENFCRAGVSKKASAMTEKQKSGGSKKGRLLGRYFQVHKKLCLPLPGLFNRGRLYKAQSCGSIVRDRVVPPSPASLLLCSDDRWCPITSAGGTKMAVADDNRHMVSNGNTGDINQNLGLGDAVVIADGIIPLGAACPGIGICHIHLGDESKCCNLC
ncbi:SNF-related serine/threonine-protein kinase isoform X3 [Zootermopsis nevadensis]|nr:SNF-related serine/threonine-protein kinase isoform X3 [Zootermopsis nevadensis]XP_021924889.1 SNF-related serine/threonine-protein kinase isoform X3 [Zootermopsis nevadensis]